MSTVLQFTPLATGTNNLSLYDNRNALYNDEMSQPEGTRMELALTINSSVANQLQSAAATINHQAQSKGVLPWSGETDIAFVTDANTVAVRWTKGQPFVLIIIGILALTALIWLYLEGWRYSKGEFVNVSTGQTDTPGQFLQSQVGNLFLNPGFLALAAGIGIVGYLYVRHQKMMFSDEFHGAKAKIYHQRGVNKAAVYKERGLNKAQVAKVRGMNKQQRIQDKHNYKHAKRMSKVKPKEE